VTRSNPDVRFSNRPFRVKHFQTIRRCSIDVAHGPVSPDSAPRPLYGAFFVKEFARTAQSRTKLRVVAGAPLQAKGGDKSSPSQVKRRGILDPSINTVERNCMSFFSCACATRGDATAMIPSSEMNFRRVTDLLQIASAPYHRVDARGTSTMYFCYFPSRLCRC
jgi:hypothetical protein